MANTTFVGGVQYRHIVQLHTQGIVADGPVWALLLQAHLRLLQATPCQVVIWV